MMQNMADLRFLLLAMSVCVTHAQTLVGPDSVAVQQGDDTTLTCRVQGGGAEPYTFTWIDTSENPVVLIFTGTARTPNQRYGNFDVSNDGTSSSMTISQIAIDDEGSYQCTSIEIATQSSPADVTVDVKGTLSNTFPSNKSVVAGQPYLVECMVSGSRPQVTISWYINDVVQVDEGLTTAQTPTNSNLSDTTIAFTFTPSKVLVPQQLELKCAVTGYRAPTISAQEAVESYSVEYPPESVEVSFNSAGTNVTCKMVVDGNPEASNFYIYVNDTLLHESTSKVNYMLLDSPDSDSVFRCVAGNEHGNVTATGTYIFQSPKGLSTGAIIGIVLGVMIAVILIVVLVVLGVKGYFDDCCSCCCSSGGSTGSNPNKVTAKPPVEEHVEMIKEDKEKAAPKAAPRKVDHQNDNPEGVEYAMVSKSSGGGGGPKGDVTDAGKNPQGQPEEGLTYAHLDLSTEAGHTTDRVPQNKNDVVVYSSILV